MSVRGKGWWRRSTSGSSASGDATPPADDWGGPDLVTVRPHGGGPGGSEHADEPASAGRGPVRAAPAPAPPAEPALQPPAPASPAAQPPAAPTSAQQAPAPQQPAPQQPAPRPPAPQAPARPGPSVPASPAPPSPGPGRPDVPAPRGGGPDVGTDDGPAVGPGDRSARGAARSAPPTSSPPWRNPGFSVDTEGAVSPEQSAEAGRTAPPPSPPRGLLGAPGWAGASAYGDPAAASPPMNDRTTEQHLPQQPQDGPARGGGPAATATPQEPFPAQGREDAPVDQHGAADGRSSKLVDAAGVGGVTGGMIAAVNWMTTRRRRREERASSRSASTAPPPQERIAPRDADTLSEDTAVPALGAAPTAPADRASDGDRTVDRTADRTDETRLGGAPARPATDEREPEAPGDPTPSEPDPSSRGGSSGAAAVALGGAAVAGGAFAASRTGRTTDDAPADDPDTTTPDPAPHTTAPDTTEPEATTVETSASPEPAATREPEPSSGPTVPSAPAADPQQVEAQSAWSARAERSKRRRRVLLVMLVAVVAILLVWAIPWLVATVSSWFSGGEERTSILPPDGATPAVSAPAARPELPRGGTTIFPGYRVVAYYGTPDNPSMGVLGDGPPEPMAQKLEEAAQAFATPGKVVQPTMELIVHVADGAPGEDGDYSHAIDEAKAWQYLAVARAHRQLLVIDIQPGSSDFLSTTEPWERLLREPDVGLALDPEWRMPPGQVPGQQIGTVSSAEVNETAEWLAGLVREANLPQKLFVVHQFTPNMITEPERLVTPPELAVVQHVDGFGGQADKIAKYRDLVRPGGLHPGFKLFYTQDTPVLSPAQALGLTPSPDFVTYQ